MNMISQLGYVGIGVKDIKAWEEFATNVLGMEPMEKLVAFKLLPPDRALALYELLDPDARYFLLSAVEPGAIAPVLEDLPPGERAAFHVLPEAYRDRMLRCLVSGPIEFHLPSRQN